ncbi:MAG: hypothetical protein Q8R76_11295 [Candidatus Omnitrophota bacterium]|nr:hypothetical protein [Candidatus Omnitrophota bacterium]
MANWFKKMLNVIKKASSPSYEKPKKLKKKKTAAKKKVVRKKKPQRKPLKTVKKRKTGKKKKAVKSKQILVGYVTHYYTGARACAIKLDKEALSNGDKIHIKGSTTDLKMKVRSLQINRIPVDRGMKGEEVGLGVKSRVRENDEVYRL